MSFKRIPEPVDPDDDGDELADSSERESNIIVECTQEIGANGDTHLLFSARGEVILSIVDEDGANILVPLGFGREGIIQLREACVHMLTHIN